MTEEKRKTGNPLFKIILVIIAVLILAGIGGKLYLNYIAEQAAISVAKQLFGGDEEDESNKNQLADTKWRYRIDVGGGVGGVMNFEKDEREFVSGTYEENGPEGKIRKKFDGVWNKETLILQLGDFPRFKVTISTDGKTMQGKPLEENKDIYYPDDFFKATLEN